MCYVIRYLSTLPKPIRRRVSSHSTTGSTADCPQPLPVAAACRPLTVKPLPHPKNQTPLPLQHIPSTHPHKVDSYLLHPALANFFTLHWPWQKKWQSVCIVSCAVSFPSTINCAVHFPSTPTIMRAIQSPLLTYL